MSKHPVRRAAVVVVALVALFAVPACSDSHESVTEDMIDKMNEGADILEGVKDEDSAKAAASELEDWASDIEELVTRAKELGDPSKEDEKALKEKFEKPLEEAGTRFGKEMMRISMNPKLSTPIAEAMKRAGEAMQKVK